MKLPLLWKFVLANLIVVTVVALITALSIRFLAAKYFMTLMEEYNVAPAAAHQMFIDSVHSYLLFSSLLGLVVAFGLSWWWTSRALRPLTQMMHSASRIAAGDFSEKIVATSNDEIGALVTSFNTMADSLKRVEQLRRDLVVDVAHELRAPLTNIRGYLEAIIDGVMPPTKELILSLQEEAMRLVKLVDNLLQLARADAARMNLQRTEVELAQLVLNAFDLFKLRFHEKQILTTVDVQAAEIIVSVDSDRLHQVLNNLLENAWRYTPQGGSFSINTLRIEDEIRLTFANTFATTTTADSGRIFERFYRGESSRSRLYGGAGIGLAIVKELVQAHNGRVGSELINEELLVWFTIQIVND